LTTPKKHCGPHKMPSRAPYGPRVFETAALDFRVQNTCVHLFKISEHLKNLF